MPATPGPQPGSKGMRPKQGKNGPGDGGRSDGVRHGPARVPKGGRLPMMTGTKNPSSKGSK